MKPVTVAFITSRVDCKVEWTIDSLARQVPVEERHLIHLLLIDRHLWSLTPEAGSTYFRRGDLISLTDARWHVESRREKFANAVKGRFDYQHLPPKPNSWQGPFRRTQFDWFVASQARNTAIMAARHDYVVFIDDLSVVMPGFWANAKHAADSGYCVAGVYRKSRDMVVVDGDLVSFTPYPQGVDSRWGAASDSGIIPWTGEAVWGCSFGVPTELLLKVNGNDEMTDGQAAEDYDLSMRIERAGGRWHLNKNLQTMESDEMHGIEPSLPREKRVVSPDRLPHGYNGNPDSDHVMLWRVRHEPRFTTLAGDNLRRLREEFLLTQRAPIPETPTHDWRTGQRLEEVVKLY